MFRVQQQFYRAEPTARTSWRQAILMGVNTRTYKFALGAALLDLAKTGRGAVPLIELASTYATHLVNRTAVRLAWEVSISDDVVQPRETLVRQVQWHDQVPLGNPPALFLAGLDHALVRTLDLAVLTAGEVLGVLLHLIHRALGTEPGRAGHEYVDATVALTGPHTNRIRVLVAEQHRDDGLNVVARLPGPFNSGHCPSPGTPKPRATCRT